MVKKDVLFADTTIRDGPLSLWADGMRTGAMLSVAGSLDEAEFAAIETIYVDPKKIVRELKEDPWERLRQLRGRIRKTPLRIITGGFRPFSGSDPVMWEIQMQCFANIGIQQARISDAWNQPAMWKYKVKVARDVGIDPVVNIIFADSPKHTDEYYAARAHELAKLDVLRICLKDPGGVLTPERMETLVPTILKNAGGKEVELHSHCTTGLGPFNAIRAVAQGIRVISVGIPPLANGNALPDVFNLVQNLRALGYKPRLNEEAARRVESRLSRIARIESQPTGNPIAPDVRQYTHQIPGGMLSNLRHQLNKIGRSDLYEPTLEEAARVRREWGWPIMVTPLSQFVGSQAAINVITGERYKEVTDQTILFALGRWGGTEAVEGMDPTIRDRILARPRAAALARREEPRLSKAEVRKRFGGPGITDEELLLRQEITPAELNEMRQARRVSYDFLDAETPLVSLIAQLSKLQGRRFSIAKSTFTIRVDVKNR